MSEPVKQIDTNLARSSRRDLVSVEGENSLISRGLADLARCCVHLEANPDRINDRTAAYFYDRGVAAWEEYQFEKAIHDFDEAIRLDPQNALYHNTRGLVRLCRDVHKPLSYAHNRLWSGDGFDEVLRDLDEAIRLDPQNAFFHNVRGIAWLDKREEDRHLKDVDQDIEYCNTAFADFEEAIRLEPGNATYFYNCGMAWMSMSADREAIKDFDTAIALDPRNPDAYYHRGLAWKRIREFDKAISDFDQSILLNPKNALYYFERGQVRLDTFYYSEGGQIRCRPLNLDLAIRDFDSAADLDPKNARTYRARARVWSQKKEFKMAVKDFETAIRVALWPDIHDYEELARLLSTCPDEKLRDGKRAIQLAKKACEVTKWKHDSQLATLAMAYAEAGQFDEAVHWQKKALELASIKFKWETYSSHLELYERKKPLRFGT